MRTSWISVTLGSLALLVISGCAAPITTREKGTLADGVIGAGRMLSQVNRTANNGDYFCRDVFIH